MGYKLTGYPYKYTIPSPYLLQRCNWTIDAQFVSKEKYESWYHDPICFPKSDEVLIRSNWWQDSFTSPVIFVQECEDTPWRLAHNRKCKSKAEITEFLQLNVFYIYHQTNDIDPDMFWDSENTK